MKIETSPDGTISVVELDPSKVYWIITSDEDVMEYLSHIFQDVPGDMITATNGLVIFKRENDELRIVENSDRIKGVSSNE